MPLVAPLVALDVLVLVLWLIAVALAIALIMDKLAAILHAVPIAGGFLSDKAHDMARVIANAAGTLEKGVDHLIGAAWHQLARYTDKLWNELVSHSAALVQIAQLVGHLVHAVHALRRLVAHAVGDVAAVLPRVKHLEKEWKGIEQGVKDLTKLLLAFGGIDALVKLLHNLHGLRDWVKGQLRPINTAIDGLTGSIADLKRFLGIKAGLSYLEWAGGIVAAVLGLEILNMLRCPSLLSNAKNRGCSQWSALDDLLGLLALGIAAAEFETLVHEAQDLTEGAITVFDEVFGLSR